MKPPSPRLPFLVFAVVLILPSFVRSAPASLDPLSETDFHCRGVAGRSVRYDGVVYPDCAGGHGPTGGVRSRLLRILNRLQTDLRQKIRISSGYRCDPHNRFSWASWASETGDEAGVSRRSLHRSGAAADFIVAGRREMSFYRELEKTVRTLTRAWGWGEDAVWTQTYAPHEVRDPDNRHESSYLHIHLRGVPRVASPPKSEGD